MWITSQPLSVEGAKEALRSVVPDLGVYLEKGQIEIIPYAHWYSKEGTFDSEIVLNDCSTSPTGSENHLASFRFQNTFLLNV